LVNYVVAPDQVMTKTRDLSDMIRGNAPIAVRQSKRVALAALAGSKEQAWVETEDAVRIVVRIEDSMRVPERLLKIVSRFGKVGMANVNDLEQVLSRLVWASDNHDIEMMGDCVTEDVRMTHIVAGRTEEPRIGRSTFVERALARWESEKEAVPDCRRHHLTSTFIEKDGDTEAVVVSNVIVTVTLDGISRVLWTGWYRNHLALQDGQWRVRDRYTYLDKPHE
jgi:hypothetical protein